MVRNVEAINYSKTLDRAEDGSVQYYLALLRNRDGGFGIGTYREDCLYSEVL